MKVKESLTKPSEPEKVDAYMKGLKHPLAGVAKALREIILKTDPEIGEEIRWNAPAFFYSGELPPFNPKEYKRHIAVFNFYKQVCIRLVFPSGARVKDKSGLLEGDYPDGRRLALFHDMREVESRKAILQRLVKQWLVTLDSARPKRFQVHAPTRPTTAVWSPAQFVDDAQLGTNSLCVVPSEALRINSVEIATPIMARLS